MAPRSTGPPVPAGSLGDRFLELTADLAAAISFDGRIVAANPAVGRLVGVEVGGPANRHAATILQRDDRAALGAVWKQLVGGRRATAELEVRLAVDEAWRWFLLSFVADPDAHLVYIIGKDVQESRAAAARLGDAEARFRAAFESSAIGITITGLDARFVRVNSAFGRLVGRPVEELTGMSVREVSHPDEWESDRRFFEGLMADAGGIAQREKRYVRPDGSEVLALLNVSTVPAADGTARYLIAQMVDITQQRAAERALAESEQRFRTLAVASPAGMFSIDFAGGMVYANDRLGEMFGMDAAEADARRWLERVDPDSRAPMMQVAETLASAGAGRVSLDVQLVPEASARWVRIHAAVLDEGDGARFLGTVDDVSAEVQARDELATREAEYRVLAEHSGDLISRHDLEGRYLYASPACETMLGRHPEELLGLTAWEAGYIHADDASVVRTMSAAIDGTSDAATFEWRAVHPDGTERWLETALRAVRDSHGAPREIVAVTRDVSERKQVERQLAHQALHDELTGLPNRALFLDRLEHALLRRHRRHGGVAVLFVDLDRFKLINDSFGHAAGDRLLCDVAARLDGALRPADTIARFGGDELVVLCEDLDGEAGARAIARRIGSLFDEPFVVEDGEAFLQASIGIAIAGDGATAADLIRDADAAMYRAKDGGRARVEIFDEAMRRDARERVATESALRRAIERDELCIHVQPVVRMGGDASIVGFEALVRWEHPERGLVAPGDFIPLAEETGLIVPIGNWVLREVCRTLARWESELGAGWVQCSLNLSVRHLQQPDLVARVRTALEEHGVRPGRLVLEITESAVMENGTGTVETLHALKALGVRLALDDFGTGYSSLAHLHRFPLDILKIDRSFTAALNADHQGASIAGAIASLAQALGLATVAEGIEDPEQRRRLADLGCTFGQGFMFSRPLPPAAFDERLRLPRPVRLTEPTRER